MFILVVLAMFSLMVNSWVLGAVVWQAGSLENNIWNNICFINFFKYIAETACMFLGYVASVLVTTMKVKEKKCIKT